MRIAAICTLCVFAGALVEPSISVADTELFLDPNVGTVAQDFQEAAFLEAAGDCILIDFDNLPAGVINGDEFSASGVTFAHGTGGELTMRQGGGLAPDTPPNVLWPVEPGQIIDIFLTQPRTGAGFYLIDSEFISATDSIDYFDPNGELILSFPPPFTNFRTSSVDGNFFIGLTSEVPIAHIRVNEIGGDLDNTGVDSLYLCGPSELEQCIEDLEEAAEELQECLALPKFEDADADGEPDGTDGCPDTAAGIEVDSNGCSLDQFCANIDATTRLGRRSCKKSDWKNDEPLMRNKDRDCTVDTGERGREDDQCVVNM